MTDPKDQPPDPFKDLGEMVEGMTQLAVVIRSAYNAHVEAGFDETQAMQLTVATLQELVRPIWGQNR